MSLNLTGDHACDGCGKRRTRRGRGQYWFLTGYHGLTGLFCASCWAKVRHVNGKPDDPNGLQLVKERMKYIRAYKWWVIRPLLSKLFGLTTQTGRFVSGQSNITNIPRTR